ncbi:hypothetical protein E4H12_10590 [Candidatus Thorarchaeota archaeon]|nr:MAG: hypothetical protein E4H12_10590 [Candidatus Thorarchaeota archaeon]
MAIQDNAYYYDHQVRNYTLQFMAIFAGMQVMVGKMNDVEPRLISVPIHYGHQDRIVASILADNTQTKPMRLPVMSAYIKGIKMANERMHGQTAERRNTYIPVGGLVPDDIQVVHQYMPVPYDLTMELAMYVSNTEQHFQILEQIFMLFNPQLNIQKSDSPFDWTRLTQVTLDDINIDTIYPSMMERRIIQSSLSFTMPIWISAPADVRRDFVEKIFVRIGKIDDTNVSNYEILAQLDEQGIQYELWFDDSDLGFE